MALIAFCLGRLIPGLTGLILAVITSIPVYLLLVKVVHGLEPADNARLSLIGNRLPGFVRGAYLTTIAFATSAPKAEPQPQ